jgi:cell fate regulator YaaT (PSP1 superfamily)
MDESSSKTTSHAEKGSESPDAVQVRIVPVKFRAAGKHYDFNARDLALAPGDRVVVETDRGRALGTVVQPSVETPRGELQGDLKNVLRLATEDDLALAATNATREADAFRFCQQRIHDRKMEMKLVRAEYLFDGSKIIFYFTADGRVDFRELVKDLAHHFRTRIEMRQIGVRDEAKLTGGIGICGRELCCCTFLTEFAPVSVRMAKEQGLALNPNKISGQCGRLLCCLGYEFETYCDLKKGLPKCGRKIHVGETDGEVISQNVLAGVVTIKLENGQTVEVPADQAGKAQEAAPAPAPAPAKGESLPPGERKPQTSRPAGETSNRGSREKDTPGQAKTPGEGDKTQQPRRRNRGRRRPRRK